MKEKNKKIHGITLIALVITIIILLILAVVTINLTMGDNGLFTMAKGAAVKYKIAQYEENINLAKFNTNTNNWEQDLETEKYWEEVKNKLKENDLFSGSEYLVKEISGENSLIVTTREGYVFTVTKKETAYIEKPVTEITISFTKQILEEGKAFNLVAHVEPDDAKNKNITWSSSNPEVAKITENDGTVTITGEKEGTAEITAMAQDGTGISANCKVKVFNAEEITIGNAQNPDDYGKGVVGYSAGGLDTWRLFYKDEKYTYIRADTPVALEGSLKANYDKCDYDNGSKVSGVGQNLNPMLKEKTSAFTAENTNENIKAVAYLTDSTNWANYVEGEGLFAIGRTVA